MSLWSEIGWTALAAFGPIILAGMIFGVFRFWQSGRDAKRSAGHHH